MTVLLNAPDRVDPEPPAREWAFANGDEIHPGLSVVTLLGGGHRYEAYLAYDERLLTTVVVKVLRPTKTTDSSALTGLAEEYEALRACNHPSICRAFDAVLEGPRPHIVLEHVEGPRLSTLIRRTRQLDADQVMALAVQVAGALHYLHGRGVVHLDVKPSNIIMSGPPRLIDLSVACSFEEAARLRTPVGTDAYMAPEQSAPTEGPPVTAAADVWGLGATLYEAVSGRRAFPRSSDEDPYPQRHHRPEPLDVVVPAEVRATIMACLDPDPSSRPSARDVVSTLEPAVALPRRIVLGRVRPRWN